MKKKLLIVLCVLCVTVSAQKKVALVIGNGEYAGYFQKLSTPVSDAIGMKNVLTAMHYEVVCDTNVNRVRMKELVGEFREKTRGADIALVYYSGHGCMVKGKYYIAPSGTIDARTISADCFPFDVIVENLKECYAPVRIAFIDACRNSVGSKGVIPMNEDPTKTYFEKAVSGFACFYASEDGTEAKTGYGKYSVFTKRLIEHIHEPGNLRDVWSKIVNAVINDSEGEGQKPDLTLGGKTKLEKIELNPDKVCVNNPFIIAEGRVAVTLRLFPSGAALSLGKQTYSDGQQLLLDLGKSYACKVSAPGHETKESTILITSLNETEYSIKLEKLEPATLSVISNVDGAVVSLDGKYIGRTPIYKENTLSGKHTIRITSSGYYPKERTLKLSAGDNYERFVLKKDYPWAWDWNEYGCPKGNVSYHFSPRYQLGLSYDHIFENHFSIGGMISTSFGAYRGWDWDIIESETYLTIGDVNDLKYKLMYGEDQDYSSFVDPYNEAKHYDANALFLVQGGYLPCNLVMFNLGLGAAYHRDKYYMENTYMIEQYFDKDEIVYTPTDDDHWYKQNTKWSPAIRLGAKFFIPLDEDQENCITIGGGYTYLPTTHKYSSWDASIGFSWQF